MYTLKSIIEEYGGLRVEEAFAILDIPKSLQGLGAENFLYNQPMVDRSVRPAIEQAGFVRFPIEPSIVDFGPFNTDHLSDERHQPPNLETRM